MPGAVGLITFTKFSIMSRKLPTTAPVSEWRCSGASEPTKDNNHEIPEAYETRRGNRILAQA